jgi:hypothetical protein
MNTFYNFQWAQRRNEILFESMKDYDEKSLFLGNVTKEIPFLVRINVGNKFYDIAHFQDPFNFAISERVYNLLIASGLTGWSCYEIRIVGRTEKYFGFQVTGRCGELEKPKEAGFYKGYKFDYNTWDGSDFFSPENTLLLFCSESAKRFFDLNNITNTDLINIKHVHAYSVGSSS